MNNLVHVFPDTAALRFRGRAPSGTDAVILDGVALSSEPPHPFATGIPQLSGESGECP